MFQPSAEIIADSVNPWGTRLTTFVLTYHRMIHSEFMTHRVMSRNSSSSRAIPIEKMIRLVEEQEVYPVYWGKNQKGMAAREELSPADQVAARRIWGSAREEAIAHARELAEIGVHKQTVNRLLEPFSTITVICSGTEFQNFFEQRCHEDAQPEIQSLANKMRDAYNISRPKEREVGQWHLPLINPVEDRDLDPKIVLKVAVGRCARVSYLTHNGIRDPQEDVKLCDRLWHDTPKHLSPFEHVARVAPRYTKNDNFDEFRSLRYELRVGALKFENGKIMEGRNAN
jgi:hypothetical protein